ncbi:methyltransferase family protein [Ornithinimicrobium cryptoxanthini]|uniref:methyltransferase family protein n=1 Tax=Ornithinimicrobium cryptoxanthini TaxID=2934161 RepID=UPI0021176BF4|nr:isoprenylcysteine carboxylmethyltransferase family protein [Ornithinimicrobium cryptoxanthini]
MDTSLYRHRLARASLERSESVSGVEWLALALFALYALVGFGIRTAVQIRRTGDSGFRGLSGSLGSVEWWAGLLFATALVAGVVAPIAGLLGLSTISALEHGWVHTAGAVLATLGIVGTFITQLDMGDNWRVGVDEDERTELVISGSFAMVRNPIFTAMLVTGAGIALVVPNGIALGSWVLLLLAVQLQVRVVEEPYLRRHHDASYQRYVARVGRFLPGVGTLR